MRIKATITYSNVDLKQVKRDRKANYLRHKRRLATEKDICPYAKRHCERMIRSYELENKGA